MSVHFYKSNVELTFLRRLQHNANQGSKRNYEDLEAKIIN